MTIAETYGGSVLELAQLIFLYPVNDISLSFRRNWFCPSEDRSHTTIAALKRLTPLPPAA